MVYIKYVGSKNKLSKELVPIIQSYINNNNIKNYLEPFVGGANIIDKIKCNKKIGCDIHKELIALFKYIQNNNVNNIPNTITKEEYIKVKNNKQEYPEWYVGLVGFCATYNAKYFGGYAGNCQTKQGIRHYDREAIRNLLKQSIHIKDINFIHSDFRKLQKNKINNYMIYCDPPYKNTTKYKTENFPYKEFYQWCKEISKNNIILISEYYMPDDFTCIWQKVHNTSLDKNDNKKKRIEKLFTYKIN